MYKELVSFDVFGSNWVWIVMPSARAVGGKFERKSRTDLVLGEKGLNLVLTSVMKRDIILAVRGMYPSGSFGLELGFSRPIGYLTGVWK